VIVIQHASAEELTSGRIISSRTNSPLAEVSTYYHDWVDTSASGLLVPEYILRPVVNASALACCITITGSIPLLVDY
jgi:hypothetical protein